MKKLFSKKLWRRLTVTFAALLTFFWVGTDVAFANSALINSVLKAQTFNIVKDPNDTDEHIYYPTDYSTAEEVKAYGTAVGTEVESEGIVLLKNKNNALPLSEKSKVSCFLYGSVNLNYASSGSSAADTSSYATLKDALEEESFSVNKTLWNFYTSGTGKSYKPSKKYNSTYKMQIYATNAAPWSVYPGDVKDSVSEYGDAALVVVARNSGEGMDISTKYSDGRDGSYLSVTDEEMEVLKALTDMKQSGKVDKIVVLLNTALAFEMSFLDDESIDVDACMWIGNLGSSGVAAVADVLVGKTTPSGRLADTYVKDNFFSPAMASWMQNSNGVFSGTYTNSVEKSLNDTQKYYGVYNEGIYVGYRYYETRYEDVVMKSEHTGSYDYSSVVAYPFGYGLSYTTFEYSDFKVTPKEDGNYEVSVTVTNVGDKYSGKEVVQIYLQKPYTDYDKKNGVEKASVELVGFAKTKPLAPHGEEGDSQTVTITVEKSCFKSYDVSGYGTYILDEGDYYLAVGKNAHDALNHILAKKGYTTEDGMDVAGDERFAALVWQNDQLDSTTYAVSSETGAAVSNQLDFCDINRYSGRGENEVTYVSRSDWEGTWPKQANSLSIATSDMEYDISSNKAIEEDEEAKMPKFGIDSGLSIMMLRSDEAEPIAYEDERWETLLDQLSFAEISKLVTDCSFQTPAIGGSVSKPGTTEQDGPTGVANSVTELSFPSEGIWASTFNTDLIQKVGDALAEDARINGLNGLYLPGINIHRSPFGGRTHEYFSEDPYLTGVSAEAEIKAVQAKGVIAHVKHFIFNDEEANRNGIGIWLDEQAAREIYLKPWEYAVMPSRGNAHAVMSSFNRAGCLWTSAGTELLQNILRDEWGFDGYVITDMASSNAALFMTYVDGFMNGTDCFLGAGSTTALNDYKNSPTFCSMIRESAHRILYVTANFSSAVNGLSSLDRVVPITPWWGVTLISVTVTFGVFTVTSAIFMGIAYWKKRKPAAP